MLISSSFQAILECLTQRKHPVQPSQKVRSAEHNDERVQALNFHQSMRLYARWHVTTGTDPSQAKRPSVRAAADRTFGAT